MQEKTIKLLIVDDDEADRLQIQRCLERTKLAYEVHEASTMRSALEQLEQSHFDCVILDYYIPDQDGLRGVKTMLASYPFLPIVMLTGQGDEAVASTAIKLGARDYSSKSKLTPAGLKRMVLNAIERSEVSRMLQEQQRSLAVFARVLAHDMKAPIQSIFGFAKLADTFLDKEPIDRDQLKKLIQRISEGAMRVNVMIDQLHAYTKADIQPAYEEIALGKVLEDVMDNLDVIIRESGASIIFDDLPTVCADQIQLTQLLQNLIANAIKFCNDRQPEIRIETQSLDNGTYVVEVRDNGIGIDGEYLDKIFEPFKRLHSQEEYEGTGLGLATCKKIVEHHNGKIWCKSRLGEGTSFFFSLPTVEHEVLPVADIA